MSVISGVPAPDAEDQEAREEYEWRQRQAREDRGAARRQRKSGWKKGQPRCGVCFHFIATPSSSCKACNFDNGLGRFPL